MNQDITQTDRRFRGPAYRHLRITDELPVYGEIDDDPICKVKLFLPGSRYTYYVFAYTEYGDDCDVVTGWCVSPLGPDCDEEGDTAVSELIELRNGHGLPLERDLSFLPVRLSEIRAQVPA